VAALRAAIERSFAGLPGAARQQFSRLALAPAGSFGPAAAALLLATDIETARETLDELAEAYLVDVIAEAPGQPRYRVNAIMRSFAREQLTAERTLPRLQAAERLAVLMPAAAGAPAPGPVFRT
jgi:hypothetical protein